MTEGWHPIATAPKDGSAVLLTGGALDNDAYTTERWPAVVGRWLGEYWVIALAEAAHVAVEYRRPTFWHELPELPAAVVLAPPQGERAMIEKPGYWMNETGDLLRPVIQRYLAGDAMNIVDIAVMRAYLQQWIERGDWIAPGDAIARLRMKVLFLTSRAEVAKWLDEAEELGIDPL